MAETSSSTCEHERGDEQPLLQNHAGSRATVETRRSARAWTRLRNACGGRPTLALRGSRHLRATCGSESPCGGLAQARVRSARARVRFARARVRYVRSRQRCKQAHRRRLTSSHACFARGGLLVSRDAACQIGARLRTVDEAGPTGGERSARARGMSLGSAAAVCRTESHVV